MGRIATNIPASVAVSNLNRTNKNLSDTLQRLSSGLRINSARDDPSGAIISELLNSELAGIEKAVENSERAGSVLATAEGALNEVSALMISLRQLVMEAANQASLSLEEQDAAQLEIDSAIDSIARIAQSTAFGGDRLLDGSFAYVTSGVIISQIINLSVFTAQFNGAQRVPVTVNILSAAQKATLEYASATVGAVDVALKITGGKGVEVIQFGANTSVALVESAVNNLTEATGVEAVVSGGSLFFLSEDFGSNHFVAVEALQGNFGTTIPGGPAAARNEGSDILGRINGVDAVGRGTTLNLNTNSLDISAKLADSFTGITQFAITGGGMLFQLGQNADAGRQLNLGIDSIDPNSLGENNVGFLSELATGGARQLSSGDFGTMIAILNSSNDTILGLRGRLGAFITNNIDTNINSLNVAMENVASAQSVIRDADFAVETANLTRNQILIESGISVLAIANTTPQRILSLLQ